MIDRLRRVVPADDIYHQRILSTLNEIISQQNKYAGKMFSEYGDKILRTAGKLNSKAVRWMDKPVRIGNTKAAVANLIGAVEDPNSMNIPAYALPVVAEAQEANVYIGEDVQHVIPGFIANGGMHRLWNSFGYDVIRLGRGKYWKRLIEGTAVANGMTTSEVTVIFNRLSELLNTPGYDMTQLFKFHQEHQRKIPKVVSHIETGWGPFKHWEPVLHSSMFNFFNFGIRRAAMMRAFREIYTPRSRGGRSINQDSKSLATAVGKDWHFLVFSLYRAMQGQPADNWVNGGVNIPTSIAEPGGWALRVLSPAGNLLRSFWLMKQAALQPGELIFGGAPIFFGFTRSMWAAKKTAWRMSKNEIVAGLEAEGAIDQVIYDNSWNRNSAIRDTFKLAANALRWSTMQLYWNQLQETQAAGASSILAQKIMDANTPRSGVKLTWLEKNLVPEAFRAMGFTEDEAELMMQGDGRLLAQMVRRAASFAGGGHAHPAESSRALAHRDFQKLIWFSKYPATRTNQLVKLVGNTWDHALNKRWKKFGNSALLLGKWAGFLPMQGLMQVMMMALFMGGFYGLWIKWNEMKDNLFAFLTDCFRSAIGGPLQMMWKGYEDGGLHGAANSLLRISAPVNIGRELWELSNSEGMYADMDAHDRVTTYLNRQIPMSAVSKMVAAQWALSEHDYKLDLAKQALDRWKMSKWGRVRGTPDYWTKDERRTFRVAMKQSLEAIKNGDTDGQTKALMKAVDAKVNLGKDPAQAVLDIQSSFRARKLLKNPQTKEALTLEERGELQKRIGSEAYFKLEGYDLMLDYASGQGR
jgi:hypothetical protein